VNEKQLKKLHKQQSYNVSFHLTLAYCTNPTEKTIQQIIPFTANEINLTGM